MRYEINFGRASLLALSFVGALGIAVAASSAIGVAVANGSFAIDNAQVFRNGTVFDGSSIETGAVTAELRLNSGSRVRVGPRSEIRAHRDGVEARGLTITPAAGSSAAVALEGGRQVEVAALQGTVVVAREGMLVARLEGGRALQFDPQASAGTSTRVVGKVVKNGDKYLLKDETSGVTFELIGPNLESYVGKNVAVTGTVEQPADATANPILKLTDVNVLAGTGAAPAGVKHSGFFTTKVIVAGVIVAAGGTAAAVALTSGGSTPISR